MATDYSGSFVSTSYATPGILLVEMNRKPVNAFHDAFWEELGQTFDRISDDGDIRVVILASRLEKAFTAGLDLQATASSFDNAHGDPSRVALKQRHHIKRFQNAISAIERCSQPVIGAAHGFILGLGVDILAACDVRYAATSAKFSIKEVDVGLAADIGSLARLPKITGNESLLRELALTARVFTTTEATQLGLISKAVEGGRNEVISSALELAREIASKSPIAVLGTKHLLIHARDHSVQDNLDYTQTWNQAMIQSDDIKQAISAFLTKKPPNFKSLPKL